MLALQHAASLTQTTCKNEANDSVHDAQADGAVLALQTKHNADKGRCFVCFLLCLHCRYESLS